MRKRLCSCVAAILWVFVEGRLLASSPPRFEPLNSSSAALVAALRSVDGVRDGQPVPEVLRAGLDLESLVEREQVISVVFRNIYNPGLKDCTKILREYSGRDLDPERILRLADAIDFSNLPRSAREATYRRALDDGFAGVGAKGWGVTRVGAMWSAANEGMSDLRASMEVAAKKLSPGESQRIVLGEALALLDLSAGENGTGGPEVAVKRLMDIPSAKLGDRMHRDGDFRKAVVGLARGSCPGRDPRDAAVSRDLCGKIREVVVRLEETIDAPERRGLATGVGAPKPAWLDELHAIISQ